MAEQTHSKTRLVRQVGVLGGVALLVGNIIGDGIFITTGPMLAEVGPALVFCFALAIIPLIFEGLYNAQLGNVLPCTMADYQATSRVLKPFVGWITVWSALCLWALCLGLMGYAFATYLQVILPGIPLLPVAFGIVILFGIINCFGIRVVTWVQIILTGLFVILPLLVFIVGGWPHMQEELHYPLFPLGVGQMFLMVAPAIWAYMGLTCITTWAGELKNPRRNIPITIAITLAVTALLYMGVAWVLSGVMPWQEGVGASIGEAAMNFLPPWLGIFVVWGALFAIMTSFNTLLMMGSRAVLALSRDNIFPFPHIFSRINRFHSPAPGVIFTTCIGLIGVAVGFEILEYALLLVIFMMIIHITDSTAVFRLPQKMPERYDKSSFKFSPFWRRFIWIGMIVFSVILMLFAIMLQWTTAPIVIGMLATGVIYWYARRAHLRRRGIDLEETMKEFTPETEAEMEGV